MNRKLNKAPLRPGVGIIALPLSHLGSFTIIHFRLIANLLHGLGRSVTAFTKVRKISSRLDQWVEICIEFGRFLECISNSYYLGIIVSSAHKQDADTVDSQCRYLSGRMTYGMPGPSMSLPSVFSLVLKSDGYLPIGTEI